MTGSKREGKWTPKKPLHPLLSIFLSVIILTIGFFLTNYNQIIYFSLFLLLLILSIGYFTTLLKILLYIIPLGLLIGFLSYFIGGKLLDSILSFFRIIIIGFSITLTFNINPARLSRSLNQIGCPRRISLAILIVFRFLPVLKQEINRIKEAMMVRGIHLHWYNPINYYRVIFLPLIITLIDLSDILTISLETRAFTPDGECSVYERVHLNTKDLITLFFSLIALISIIFIFWW
ncbi:MAG: energy-coupling factor transporter transmembrane component T family protein [Promethearchaeia archaeon]